MIMAFQNPVAAVQNPAFGATLLWQFGLGYQKEASDTPVMLLHFLVLPLVLHAPTLEHVLSTRSSSSLSLLSSKIAEKREDLVAVHGRAVKLRSLTLDSISAGITSKLLNIDYATAKVRSNDARKPNVPERTKQHYLAAEKLGHWLARTPPHQAFTLLQVEI